MKKETFDWSDLIAKFIAAMTWNCFYGFLITVVWNWASGFVDLPKMGFWVALSIYLLLHNLLKK